MWTFSSSVIERGFVFVTYALIARMISKDSYGILLLVLSTINVATTILSSGTSLIITRQIAQNGYEEKQESTIILNAAILFNIIIGGILLIIFFYFGSNIANVISGEENNSNLIKQLKVLAPILLFQSLSVIFLAYLQGFELFKIFTISNIFKGSSLLLFVLIFGYFFNINGVTLAFTVASVTSMLFLVFLIVKNNVWSLLGFSFSKIKSKKHALIKYFYLALPLILLSIVQITGDWLAQVILSKRTNDWGAVAEFGVARQYAFILPMASAAITQGVLPILSKRSENSNNDIISFVKTSFSIQIILGALGLFFAPYFIPLIFGDDLKGAVIFAKTLIISYTIFGVFWMIGPVLLAKGRTVLLLIFQTFRTLAILVSVFVLINIYGKIGIVYGYLLAEIIAALIIMIYFYKKIFFIIKKINFFLLNQFPLIVLSGLLFFINSSLIRVLFLIVFVITCFSFLKLIIASKKP